jgi:hypothetical protein
MKYVAQLETRVDTLANLGRYMTPECTYLEARLRFIRDGDERALHDMLRHVTLDNWDLDD